MPNLHDGAANFTIEQEGRFGEQPQIRVLSQHIGIYMSLLWIMVSIVLLLFGLIDLRNDGQVWLQPPCRPNGAFFAAIATIFLRVHNTQQISIPWIQYRQTSSNGHAGVVSILIMCSTLLSIAAATLIRYSPFLNTLLDFLADALLSIGIWVSGCGCAGCSNDCG